MSIPVRAGALAEWLGALTADAPPPAPANPAPAADTTDPTEIEETTHG